MFWKDQNSGQGKAKVVEKNSTSHLSRIRLEIQQDLCVCTYTSAILCAFPTFLLFLLLLQLNFRT